MSTVWLRQHGTPAAFCHRLSRTCWGDDGGVSHLERVLLARREAAAPGSYTKRLFDDAALLRSKLLEEAQVWGAGHRLHVSVASMGGVAVGVVSNAVELIARRWPMRGGCSLCRLAPVPVCWMVPAALFCATVGMVVGVRVCIPVGVSSCVCVHVVV